MNGASAPGYLLTASKDNFLKLWDLGTQHCVETVVAHRSEIWSFDVDAEEETILTGSGDGEVKAWKIDRVALAAGLTEGEGGKVSSLVPSETLDLSLIGWSIVEEDDSPLWSAPSYFPASGHPNRLPPISTICSRPLSRPLR